MKNHIEMLTDISNANDIRCKSLTDDKRVEVKTNNVDNYRISVKYLCTEKIKIKSQRRCSNETPTSFCGERERRRT